MPRPQLTEHASYHLNYISLVMEEDILAALTVQLDELLAMMRSVAPIEENICHAPYTWTIREVLGHMIDSERVFGYRTLRFARGDATPLPGFDENEYAKAAPYKAYPLHELIAEFESLRRSHVWMFRHMPAETWSRTGVANDHAISVRAMAYILVGHVRHHLNIVKKRLLGTAAAGAGKK